MPPTIDIPDKICKLLFFMNETQEIDSKTKIQKMVFLLQKEHHLNLGFEFISYNYGPYSFDLTDALETLTILGLVEEHTVYFGNDDKSLFPLKQIKYKITEKGEKTAKDIERRTSFTDSEKLAIKKVISDWKDKSREEIVAYVYSKYMTEDGDLSPSM